MINRRAVCFEAATTVTTKTIYDVAAAAGNVWNRRRIAVSWVASKPGSTHSTSHAFEFRTAAPVVICLSF